MESDRQDIEIGKMREFVDFENKSVLEIGCGDGRASAMLAGLARSLVAIDPDENRLSIARSRVSGVDFRAGTGEELEFPDGAFDIVAFTFSLHHQDSAKALAEAKRVLRSSGRVLVIEPAIGGDMHMLFSAFRDEDPQIAAAQAAIANCGMPVRKSDAFDIEYVFNDAEDIYQYFFGHFTIPRDRTHIARIDAVLGDRVAARPITLRETVNIYSLIKI